MRKLSMGLMAVATCAVLNFMLPCGNAYGDEGKAFVSDENTVALWNFKEGEGTVIHDSGPLGIDLTVGDYGEGTPPKWVEGKFGKALLFNGDNKRECGNFGRNKYLGLKNEVTFEAWIKPNEPPAEIRGMGLFQNMMSKECGFRIGMSSKGKISFIVGDGKQDFNLNSNKDVPLNEWSHIAATYDGKAMKIFINGVEDSQKLLEGGIVQAKTDIFCLGNYYFRYNYYYGAVGGIRISNIAKKEFYLK